MMKKRLLSTLLALCVALALLPVTALAAETSGSCGDNVTWSFSDGTLTIQGTGDIRDYYLLSDSAPWHDDFGLLIRNVKIGDGVTSIGDYAFSDLMNLTSVTIPVGVTSIGSSAFRDCQNLTSVTIPNTVTSIGQSAFQQCFSLTSLTIPNSVTSIGDYAFSSCWGLTSITIPESVTSIGEGLFSGCSGLTSVTIPSNFTSIPDSFFSVCKNLTSVTIPDGVTSIGDHAFRFCEGLTSITIPASVTSIGERAFESCEGLTSITIPAGATSIGESAFYDCTGLTSITIPAGVTSIGKNTFLRCRGLTSITIPASVTSIGLNAFSGCSSLKDVYYGGSESQWKQINIDEYNEALLNPSKVTIHCNSQTPNAPTTPTQPEQPTTPSTPNTPATNAVLSPQGLRVDGKNIDCEKYNIADRNYFKLRDLAQLLSGTGSQFEVGYDEATATVSITTGKAYTPNGTELLAGVDNSATAQPSNQAILIDGVSHSGLTVYNIGGSNFFQLRELGDILGFEVDFDQDTNTAIVNSVEK